MGVRRFEDLIAWQLASVLVDEVFAFTARSPCVHDRKFCDQIRDSSRSATRNISEAFGRYYPKEMIRYVRIAVGSLHETQNHLHDGNKRDYLSDSEHERLLRLARRSTKATTRWIAYLQHARAPEPRPRDNKPRKSGKTDTRT